jgi:hypothetical protein
MRHRPLFLLSAAAVLTTGCASSSSTADDAAAPAASGWSGSFQPTQQRTGKLAPTRLQQAGGTVRLRQSARDPQRTSVALTVSTQLQDPTSLRWAVLPGRCGTGSLPLLGFEQFPPLDVTSSGRGQMEVDIATPLPQSGTYHVNVYFGGTELENVLTCANLRRS